MTVEICRTAKQIGERRLSEIVAANGADTVVWPEMEAALEIMRLSLIDLGFGEQRVERLVTDARTTLDLGEEDEAGRPGPH